MEIFYLLVFPGFLFLALAGLFGEYIDRILYARLQSRVGPPWFQPFADIIKLFSKENLIPEEANPQIFKLMPLIALTAAVTSIVYIPLWTINALYSFNGDIIVVLYLLTLPTIAIFVGGWYSSSLFARIGSARLIIQLLAYEVPMVMAILGAALLANSWTISEIAAFYSSHPWFLLCNLIGFFVCLVALLGKLEKAPFDIPEAETEIVGGTFTEYSGKYLAFFRLTLDIEAIVASSLVAIIFFPFGLGINPILGFILYLIKVEFIITLLAIARTIFARFRIDQMMDFCWKFIVPLAMLQLIIDLVVKRVIFK